MSVKKPKYEYKNLTCLGCGCLFDSKTRNKKQKYCTQSCRGTHLDAGVRFKKGESSWNKDTNKSGMSGKTHSQETKDKMRESSLGEKAGNWRFCIGVYSMVKLNSYDVLAWWGKVLNSCNTEDQFKNALNLWPKVIKLVPYIHDAWVEVVRAARFKLSRIVPPLNRISRNHVITVNYPETSEELVKHVFNQYLPPVKL